MTRDASASLFFWGMSMARRWSCVDLEKVVALGRSGKSWNEIGTLMEREPSACWGAFQRAAGDDDRRERERALLARGETRGRWQGIGSRMEMAGN